MSQRLKRIAACRTSPGKNHYATRAEAVNVAAIRTSTPSKARYLRVYECPCGGGFCLTSKAPSIRSAYPSQ